MTFLFLSCFYCRPLSLLLHKLFVPTLYIGNVVIHKMYCTSEQPAWNILYNNSQAIGSIGTYCHSKGTHTTIICTTNETHCAYSQSDGKK